MEKWELKYIKDIMYRNEDGISLMQISVDKETDTVTSVTILDYEAALEAYDAEATEEFMEFMAIYLYGMKDELLEEKPEFTRYRKFFCNEICFRKVE